MTALDQRPAERTARTEPGTVTISVRSLERMAVAIVHEELGVEVSAIRVRLSDDRGGLALAVTAPVVVEYPVPMQKVADSVRAAVSEAITELIGMAVSEINVAIVDVHIPGEDKGDTETESRVR